MKCRRGLQFSVITWLVLGLVVLLVVMGILQIMGVFTEQKFFGKTGIFAQKVPEREFLPYCEQDFTKRIKLPADIDGSMKVIVEMMIYCKKQAMDADFPEDAWCAELDSREWPYEVQVDEDHIIAFMREHRDEFGEDAKEVDFLLEWGGFRRWKLENRFEIDTGSKMLDGTHSPFCVDFRHGTKMNYLSLNYCNLEAYEPKPEECGESLNIREAKP